MSLKSVNFEFLRPNLELLADLAACAENVLFSDAGSTLVRLRSFAEETVREIYRQDHLPSLPKANFYELLNDNVFKNHVDKRLFLMLDSLRIHGNPAAHGKVVNNRQTAETCLKTAHNIAKYMAIRYLAKKLENLPAYQAINDPDIIQKIRQADYEALQNELEQLRQTLSHQKQLNDVELANIQARSEQTAQSLQWNEAETRRLVIDAMLAQAHWNLHNPEEIGLEVELIMSDGTKGYADYVLWGDNGQPLAVVEAKRTAKNAMLGREQARQYANAFEKAGFQRPVIFYTNGYETYIWDDKQYNSPRQIFGLYSKSSLEYLIYQRTYRDNNLENDNPDLSIAGRTYQIEAIKSVASAFFEQRRKALIIQATGTGKTRVAIALTKLLLVKNWAKRVLFLCDRRELRKQADNAFKDFLGSESRCVIGETNEVPKDSRIYISTYQAMIGRFEQFDVGFFDLIIADESHRSIYNKYRDLFDYFDSLQLGLTATPVRYISRNTFQMFGCESTDPTYAYGFEEAVNDGHLVPYRALDLTTEFLREGIHYNDLSEEQKRQLEEDLGEEIAQNTAIEGKDIGRKIFSISTDKEILSNLINNGIKDETGTLVGKSIIFAQRQDHAEHLEKLFCEMYPNYGNRVCKVIHTNIAKVDMLLDEFKQPDNDFRIAISVDMLDTGIDIPEVVNLVFARPVKSQVKFWQMIGRGTRLRPNLFGEGKHKTQFYIFDHYGNFRYFAEDYQEPEDITSKSLLQLLFEERVKCYQTALKQSNFNAFDLMVELIQKDIADLPENSVSVKKNLRTVHLLQQSQLLQKADAQTQQLLIGEIAPLMGFRTLQDKEASAFDKLIVQAQTNLMLNNSSFENNRSEILQRINRLPVNLQVVRAKQTFIEQVRGAEFWQQIDVMKLEQIRQQLRDLMKYVEGTGGGYTLGTLTTATQDTALEGQIAPYIGEQELSIYRNRIKEVFKAHLTQSPVLQKIRNGEGVTQEEMAELSSLILTNCPDISQNILTSFFGQTADELQYRLRAMVGLDTDYLEKHFEQFIHQNGTLSSKQVRFLNLLKNFIATHGGIKELESLYQAPFTSIDSLGIDGVFDTTNQADMLIEVIKPFIIKDS